MQQWFCKIDLFAGFAQGQFGMREKVDHFRNTLKKLAVLAENKASISLDDFDVKKSIDTPRQQ